MALPSLLQACTKAGCPGLERKKGRDSAEKSIISLWSFDPHRNADAVQWTAFCLHDLVSVNVTNAHYLTLCSVLRFLLNPWN